MPGDLPMMAGACRGRALLLVVCLAALAGPGLAQEAETLHRNLELPAQRMLMRLIDTPGTPLAPFTTDGCSGGLSSIWKTVAALFPGFAETHDELPPWQECCIAHDRRYHDAGGAMTPEAGYEARRAADADLRACVAATGETRLQALAQTYGAAPETVRSIYEAIADSMFAAVRLGGGPCTGLPFRWGYGYPGCLWQAD